VIVFLDVNIVIYAVERPPMFGPRAAARIARSTTAGDTFVVSHLIRMECLVGPLRTGSPVVLSQYNTFFGSPHVRVVDITAAVCDRAAAIRATHRFAALDSLHLAAAVQNGGDVFLTNDTRLSRFPDLTVEVLP
jgi:predicted nucleic acid-binding protein